MLHGIEDHGRRRGIVYWESHQADVHYTREAVLSRSCPVCGGLDLPYPVGSEMPAGEGVISEVMHR